MRGLGEGVIDIFVADLAGVRAGVALRKPLCGYPPGGSRQEETEHHYVPSHNLTELASNSFLADYGVCTESTANCAPEE